MVKPQEDKRLVSLSLQQFVKSVGARTAAPGGGSVSAAVAALVRKQKTKHTSVKKNLPQVLASCVSFRGRHWVPWWVR